MAGPSIETIDGVAAFEPGQEPSVGALWLQSLLFPKNGPARSCSALIDAAWVFGLPERLEAAELQAKCLFKGDAADEFGDVAPWLVQLEEGADFTRDLLTASDAHRHNWADEPGIFILSDQPFEQIYAHLRKFTKLRDGRRPCRLRRSIFSGIAKRSR